MKEFEINYNNSIHRIEIDDNPKAGVINKILKSCLKQKVGSPLPDIDYEEYLVGMACNLILKAPWALQNPQAIRDLPWNTYADLAEKLGDEFPLENFLYPSGKLIFGKKLKKSDLQLQTDSTTSVPEDLVGLNVK